MAKRRTPESRSSPKKAAIKKRTADVARATAGSQVTSLNSQVAATIRREVRSAVRSAVPTIISTISNADWLGPQQPVQPSAPQDSSDVRAWDYPVGYNVNFTPRKYTPYSAQQLQWLADNFDLLREVIENRKNEVVQLEWDIVACEDQDVDPAIIDGVKQFFKTPDGIHPYTTWLRMLLEDMYVTDSASVYIWPKRNGDPYRFEVVSGATILPLIDEVGHAPGPGEPAYQQIIHGLVYNNFTREELIYAPRNLRPYSPIYGYSNTEQLVMSIATGIKMEMSQLYRYTQGSIPDALIGVPETWTATQIARFQAYFDNMMRGNLPRRSGGAIFVAGGMKDIALKDYKFDLPQWEWLARVVCAAFHVSPQPYINQVNRATSQTAQLQEIDEALEPEKEWVKAVHDAIIERAWPKLQGVVEFHYKESDEIDLLEQSQAEHEQLNDAIFSLNEIRVAHGNDPVPGGDKFYRTIGNSVYEVTEAGLVAVAPATPPVPPGGPDDSGKPGLNGNGNGKAPANGTKPDDASKVLKNAVNGRRFVEKDGYFIPLNVL